MRVYSGNRLYLQRAGFVCSYNGKNCKVANPSILRRSFRSYTFCRRGVVLFILGGIIGVLICGKKTKWKRSILLYHLQLFLFRKEAGLTLLGIGLTYLPSRFGRNTGWYHAGDELTPNNLVRWAESEGIEVLICTVLWLGPWVVRDILTNLFSTSLGSTRRGVVILLRLLGDNS